MVPTESIERSFLKINLNMIIKKDLVTLSKDIRRTVDLKKVRKLQFDKNAFGPR
jgi:hypothetical protein